MLYLRDNDFRCQTLFFLGKNIIRHWLALGIGIFIALPCALPTHAIGLL
jgi:hypothetical protein